jgi:hypothetical protein
VTTKSKHFLVLSMMRGKRNDIKTRFVHSMTHTHPPAVVSKEYVAKSKNFPNLYGNPNRMETNTVELTKAA